MVGAILELAGRGLSGAGEVKANFERAGQKKRLGWLQEMAETPVRRIGRELKRGYAPGGWYRTLVSGEQAMQAERERAAAERFRDTEALRLGGIRSGAMSSPVRGSWITREAGAGAAGDLGGISGGMDFDIGGRYRQAQKYSPTPVDNPYAGFAGFLRGTGQNLNASGGPGAAPIRYDSNGVGYWGTGAETYQGW